MIWSRVFSELVKLAALLVVVPSSTVYSSPSFVIAARRIADSAAAPHIALAGKGHPRNRVRDALDGLVVR